MHWTANCPKPHRKWRLLITKKDWQSGYWDWQSGLFPGCGEILNNRVETGAENDRVKTGTKTDRVETGTKNDRVKAGTDRVETDWVPCFPEVGIFTTNHWTKPSLNSPQMLLCQWEHFALGVTVHIEHKRRHFRLGPQQWCAYGHRKDDGDDKGDDSGHDPIKTLRIANMEVLKRQRGKQVGKTDAKQTSAGMIWGWTLA